MCCPDVAKHCGKYHRSCRRNIITQQKLRQQRHVCICESAELLFCYYSTDVAVASGPLFPKCCSNVTFFAFGKQSLQTVIATSVFTVGKLFPWQIQKQIAFILPECSRQTLLSKSVPTVRHNSFALGWDRCFEELLRKQWAPLFVDCRSNLFGRRCAPQRDCSCTSFLPTVAACIFSTFALHDASRNSASP
ncbi:hypothetical protein ANAPC5_01336 [Anaplasma phagocytophilum]|nr:hypothetical protein ANAPC5_01336 [Anaplasma phagocytophilum]